MPTSSLVLWPDLVHLVWEAQPKSVLDVGPGFGKGGLLLREYVGTPPRGPIERLDAVEAWRPYVEAAPWLQTVYDAVIQGDVRDLADSALASYDVVLMVDVIEHLTKADGLALLARIPGRVVISTPSSFFQNPEAGSIPPEEHRSLWHPAEFEGRAEALYESHGGILARLGPLG